MNALDAPEARQQPRPSTPTLVVPPICLLTRLQVCIAESETNAPVGAPFSMERARGFFQDCLKGVVSARLGANCKVRCMRQVHALCVRLIANCVLVLAGIEPACGQQPSQAIDRIFSELTAPGSPGCAVGVYRDGKIIFAKGYGLADVEENVPITPQTVFDVGSVSKQFTGASIVLLEKQGKLRLDDDVRKYIPELSDYSRDGKKITILQLLNHTSGLRD